MKSNGFVSKFLVGAALAAISSFIGISGAEYRGPNAQIIYGPNYSYSNSNTDRRGYTSHNPWKGKPSNIRQHKIY